MRAALAAVALFGVAASAGGQTPLDPLLTPFVSRWLPAIAATVVKEGKVIAVGAVGTRKAGANIPVTVNDRFHLGSDTKAMTALLVAMFVEEGKIRWNSTVSEIFPELAAKMDSGLQRVTIEQLLSHTSGIPSDNKVLDDLLNKSLLQDGNLDGLRYWLVSNGARSRWKPNRARSSPMRT